MLSALAFHENLFLGEIGILSPVQRVFAGHLAFLWPHERLKFCTGAGCPTNPLKFKSILETEEQCKLF